MVGPEVTAAQLAALVSAGLSQGAEQGDSVSAPVLFGNDSYALSAAAVSELTRLLPRLREAGVTAVINGFASTPGTAEANYVLSYRASDSSRSFFRITWDTGIFADHRGPRCDRPDLVRGRRARTGGCWW